MEMCEGRIEVKKIIKKIKIKIKIKIRDMRIIIIMKMR